MGGALNEQGQGHMMLLYDFRGTEQAIGRALYEQVPDHIILSVFQGHGTTVGRAFYEQGQSQLMKMPVFQGHGAGYVRVTL